MEPALTEDLAAQFVRIALGHVTREWPNKPGHVLAGPEDVKRPRDLHPVFYGSFDWHSAVHAHWLLARLYRRFPDSETAKRIAAHLDAQLVPEKIAGECAYFDRPASRSFERPYGWAWLLMLAGELARHDSGAGRRWAAALTPLALAIAERFKSYLPLATYPVRAGVHSNTAFALLLARDYANAWGDAALASLCSERARAWYGGDKDCQAWEPSGDAFLSPALIEAALMQAVLEQDAFRVWFADFLPRGGAGEPAALFSPAIVSDRRDGIIAHLDGLNLSRAWCWRLIAAQLPQGAPLRARAQTAAAAHLDAARPHVAGDYAGEHWLASFALLALDPWP